LNKCFKTVDIQINNTSCSNRKTLHLNTEYGTRSQLFNEILTNNTYNNMQSLLERLKQIKRLSTHAVSQDIQANTIFE